MSRFMLDVGDKYHISWGKDHMPVIGYFLQVYTNGEHDAECECLQCEYDHPEHEFDRLDGFTGIYEKVKELIDADAADRVFRYTVFNDDEYPTVAEDE